MDPRQATIRFTGFAELDATEMLLLKDLAGPTRRLSRGETIRKEGEPSPRMYLLRDGWTASSIKLADGARQIIKVHMPGDMLGMPSLAMKYAPDTIFALTDVSLSVVELAALTRLFTDSPRLAALLFLISQEERVMLMDRLVALGRTNALIRLGALLLQLHSRWLRNNPDSGPTFPLPLTQRDLADLAGLTAVHTSRVLSKLRRAGILAVRSYTVTIMDLSALRELVSMPSRELDRNQRWIPSSEVDCDCVGGRGSASRN